MSRRRIFIIILGCVVIAAIINLMRDGDNATILTILGVWIADKALDEIRNETEADE